MFFRLHPNWKFWRIFQRELFEDEHQFAKENMLNYYSWRNVKFGKVYEWSTNIYDSILIIKKDYLTYDSEFHDSDHQARLVVF